MLLILWRPLFDANAFFLHVGGRRTLNIMNIGLPDIEVSHGNKIDGNHRR